MTTDNLKQKLEVLLFMSRAPIPVKELAEYLEAKPNEVQPALAELAQKYATPEYGIQIINVSNGYQFATKPEYAKTLELYINAPQEVSLSTAAMETLVIIAYRQPISRSEVEAIRGVNSDGIIKSLVDKNLLEEQGRSEGLGRPTLYGTTDAFLKHFGLRDLQDLPPEPLFKMQNNKEAQEKLAKFHSAVAENLELITAEAESPEAEKTYSPFEISNSPEN